MNTYTSYFNVERNTYCVAKIVDTSSIFMHACATRSDSEKLADAYNNGIPMCRGAKEFNNACGICPRCLYAVSNVTTQQNVTPDAQEATSSVNIRLPMQPIHTDKHGVKRFVENKGCIKAELNNEILGLTLIDDETSRAWRENSIQICYIDGNFESAVDMLKFLKTFCKESGIKKVYAFSCNHQPVVHAFEQLGFKKEDTEIVYEKILD